MEDQSLQKYPDMVISKVLNIQKKGKMIPPTILNKRTLVKLVLQQLWGLKKSFFLSSFQNYTGVPCWEVGVGAHGLQQGRKVITPPTSIISWKMHSQGKKCHKDVE